MAKFLKVALIGFVALTVVACNTVQGAGKDIESVGKAGKEVIND